MRTSDPVLSAKEIAEFLGMHYDTALDHLAAGRIRGVKRGNRWYIRQSALDAYLEPDTDARATA